MKRVARILFSKAVFLALLASALGPAPVHAVLDQAPKIAKQVGALDADRRQAMIDADRRTLELIMAEDMTYTHSTARVQSREELITMLESGTVDYRSIDTSETSFAVYRGSVIVTGRQKIELTVRGEPLISVSRYTAVYVWSGSSWKLAAYQSTAIPTEE